MKSSQARPGASTVEELSSAGLQGGVCSAVGLPLGLRAAAVWMDCIKAAASGLKLLAAR